MPTPLELYQAGVERHSIRVKELTDKLNETEPDKKARKRGMAGATRNVYRAKDRKNLKVQLDSSRRKLDNFRKLVKIEKRRMKQQQAEREEAKRQKAECHAMFCTAPHCSVRSQLLAEHSVHAGPFANEPQTDTGFGVRSQGMTRADWMLLAPTFMCHTARSKLRAEAAPWYPAPKPQSQPCRL